MTCGFFTEWVVKKWSRLTQPKSNEKITPVDSIQQDPWNELGSEVGHQDATCSFQRLERIKLENGNFLQ